MDKCITLLLTAILLAAQSATAAAGSDLLSADPTHCILRLTTPATGLETVSLDGETYHRLRQEGMREVQTAGAPGLVSHTFSLEIPATSDVVCDYDADYVTLTGVRLLPTGESAEPQPGAAPPAPDQDIYGADRFFPAEIVSISPPAIMRNHRLVQVAVTPYQYNPVTGELRVYTELELDFRFEGANPVNQLTRELPPAAAFEKLLSEAVVNYDAMLPVREEGGSRRDREGSSGLDPILYIHDTGANQYLDQLLEWKRQQGHVVYEATEADVSLENSAQIRNYIQTAYEEWEPPPVFVALVGDPSSCSFGRVVASNSNGDHGYSQLAGDDILADVFVGRLSVDNITQLANVVNKQLSYERNPYTGSWDWFDGALLIGDNSLSGMSTVYTNENIRYKMEEAGFGNVITCYAYQGCNEVNTIISSFNDGILYLNYRGWLGMSGWSNSYVNSLNNGYMLPFVVTITCGTGDYVGWTSYTEGFYQGGSISTPRGAIAAIGTATSGTHTRYNNAVDVGVFSGIFDHGLRTGGEALFRGKFDLWCAYQSVAPGDVVNYSNWNNLIGDPSLMLRTAEPLLLTVECPDDLPGGATALPVTVTAGLEPVAEAVVTLYRGGTEGFQLTTVTDSDGAALLPLEGIIGTSNALLTVSGVNLSPIQQQLAFVTAGVYVDVAAWELDDDAEGESDGNGDGQLDPGETIELRPLMTNLGNLTTATGITVTLTSEDPRLQLTQVTTTVPDLPPEGTADCAEPLVFTCSEMIAADLPPQILLTLGITSDQGEYTAATVVPLLEPLLAVEQLLPDPFGDGVIDPEETGALQVVLHNQGEVVFPFSNAELTCDDPWLTVVSGLSGYNAIPPDGSETNLTFFEVQPLEGCFYGQLVPLQLTLSAAEGPTQQLQLELAVGTVTETDPIGPAADIYYCFDSGDIFYSQHPLFNWMEISEIVEEPLPLTDYGDEDDDSEWVELPFEFTYFDQTYDTITVCSNGWIGMGNQEDQVNYRNYPIPAGIGPAAMIAPFWDDLRTTAGGDPDGKVFCYHDAPNHRFIVEWYDLQQVGPGSPSETFQVILYDQDYLDTPNGDILFQYLDVTNNHNNSWTDNNYATVGIESPDQTQGLEYSYWNQYPTGAAPLADDLAILFTQQRGVFSTEDIWPPVITHLPSPWQEGSDPYPVSAEITDDSGIDHADLHWSLDNETFQTVAMENSGGDSWLGYIPGQEIATRVYYYFTAVDASDNANGASTPVYNFIVGEWQTLFSDDMEQGQGDWTHEAPVDWNDQWHLSQEDYASATHSWKCGDSGAGEYTEFLDAHLLLPELTVPPEARLRFQHRIQAEVSGSYPDSAYDGGVVEFTLDGEEWQQLEPLTGGYNKHFRWTAGSGNPVTHPFPGGTPCFSGELAWQESTFSLLEYTGETVQIRFRFGSDQSIGMEGWYIDDVVVENFFPPDAVSDDPQPQLPQCITLSQNYPNPFNPATTIEFALPQPREIRLAVYNVLGQRVVLLAEKNCNAGTHRVQFDGSSFPSGVYIYRLSAGDAVLCRKMMLVK